MTSAPPWLSRSHTAALRALQHLLVAVRGKRATHVVISGPDLLGRDDLLRQLRQVMPEWNVPVGGKKASETEGDFGRLVISSHADDDLDVEAVVNTVGRYRRVLVVAVVADPRQLVCDRDPAIAHQYADSADYRFLLGEEGLRSFTEPGVIPRFHALTAWRKTTKADLFTVTRESLERDASSKVREIIDWLRTKGAAVGPSRGEGATGRPPSSSLSAPFRDSPAGQHRVLGQCQVHPELEEIAVGNGYPRLSEIIGKKRVPKRVPGTVIAFHTPDEIYRAEAERLKSSLDRLGIRHRFYEVTPEKNWVRTTLLKPSWILPVREELAGELLYIDVDAFVHEDPWPYLSQYDGDMGAVVYRNGQLNSATLWINDTPGARAILRRWKELADARRGADRGDLEATGDNGDQGVLKQAVLEDEVSASPQFWFQRLPVNLAYIFDRTDTYCVGPILIEQLQASRESLGHDKRLARRRARLSELQVH